MNAYKTKKRNDSKYRTYTKLRVFLTRKKIKNPGKVASFLLNKFVHTSQKWEHFLSTELIGLGIVEKNKFTEWREKMEKEKILEWKGRDKSTSFQNGYYKPGEAILKYINEEKGKFDVLATMSNIDYIDNKHAMQIQNQNDRIEKLEKDMKSIAGIVLYSFPPDTEERRKIVIENIDNKEKCIQLLNYWNKTK